ncbi:MAG TPA: hypothetical protein VMV37_03840 [Gammaproteobacteria bacterium]|nr:hypothetical protein [Gammaproteobacteria bacterium]
MNTGAWILAALAGPWLAFAQETSSQQILEGLNDAVRAAEVEGGPNSRDMIQPLSALGVVYREQGEPALAFGALEQALHLVRFNYGLFSLEQAPLIRQQIATAESLGDHLTAWKLERGLLKLGRRHPDDLRTAQILSDTADRRMEMLAKYDAGQSQPEVVYGCYYSGPHVIKDTIAPARECMSGSAGAVRLAFATEARYYYEHAVDIMLRNKSYSSELPRLLKALVVIGYQYDDPESGRRSLNYLLAYQASNSAPWRDRIDTLVQIADWDLLHAVGLDEENRALAEYADAYELLRRKGVEEPSIRELFAPDTPVALPVFMPNPLAADDKDEVSGHIDAAFEVDKYGRSHRVQILDATDEATRAAERHVQHLILERRFRPRLIDGRVADRDRVVIRYSLSD